MFSHESHSPYEQPYHIIKWKLVGGWGLVNASASSCGHRFSYAKVCNLQSSIRLVATPL